MPIIGEDFFCSWSGGKDSSLALFRALKETARPRMLLTMMTEQGVRSRSHGLSASLLKAQADALGIPLMMRLASWDSYESEFIDALRIMKRDGIEVGVFGDIDLEPHLQWVQKVCAIVGIKPYHPLWGEKRDALLDELLASGFKATIVAVKDGTLDRRFLGKTIDAAVVDELKDAGIDTSGEAGEYHTVVTDGPMFSKPLMLKKGSVELRDGYLFLDVSSRSRK